MCGKKVCPIVRGRFFTGRQCASCMWKDSLLQHLYIRRSPHTLKAATAASRTSAAKSAPEKPAVRCEAPKVSRSTSAAKGVGRAAALNMAERPPGDGNGTYSALSNRPGLGHALGIRCGVTSPQQVYWRHQDSCSMQCKYAIQNPHMEKQDTSSFCFVHTNECWSYACLEVW